MTSIVYVNTPLEKPDHDRLASLAKTNGRSKGMQLRVMLQEWLAANPTPSRPSKKGARK